MMFYLWIALGGALGSVSRAWLAIVVARITGPQFPWGTILINIVGSFIIGFFGTLTVSDSRFAVPTDIRAFVMVGICGGFTTFSSFSLQTLELMQDGRVGQALGNIGLSVVLCLMAVAAGHYGAGAIPRHPSVAAVPGGKAMGEVVVAVMSRPDQAESLLDAGARLLQITGGGRLKTIAVRLPPAATILPSEEVLTASREASVRAEQENWAGRLEAVVRDWQHRANRQGIQTDWVDIEGDPVTVITDHGRRADAIVVPRLSDDASERMRESMHAALFDTDNLVLIMPLGYSKPLGHVVAIAWKNDERAIKAVHACLPILRRADSVHVLCADAAAEMPLILQEHGVKAELHSVPDRAGSIGERILHAAHQVGADLLVMGAFAHGEWREYFFGGVTQYMLANADLPLLVRH